MSATKSKRSANTGRLLIVCLVVGLAAGLGAGVVSSFTPVPAPIANGVAVLLVGGLGVWRSREWWLNVDEGVREAHKFGWFWGGSAGLLIASAIGLALQGIGTGAVAQFGIEPRDANLVFTGIVLALGLMMVGYGVCWAGWWIARR